MCSPSDFRSVERTQRETGCVRPCSMESIRQHFTPSVNASLYFSKSLAIGLPLSRTDTKRDGSCPSVSDVVDPPTFYTLCKRFSVFLSLSRSDFRSVRPLPIPDDPTQFRCIGHVWVYFPQWSLFCALAPSILLVVESETEAHLPKKKFTKFLLLLHVCYGI